MNFGTYMQRIEDAIGKIHAADRIDEDSWFDVVLRELNAVSRDCADELGQDAGIAYEKPGYLLQCHEAPPPRLLGLVLPLAAWLGWVMREKHGESGKILSAEDCLRRIQEAFEYGVQLSRNGKRP